ncbi:MAG: metallophosphoesterase family protein, partial [Flavisolibacter sp.]
HGGKQEEIEYGRISSLTIERIERALSESNETPINIILCHHHPHQFPERFDNDDTKEVMKNGQLLLERLGNGRYGSWIVIHGHKHHARVGYSQGGNSSPFVMAAGSFSAVIYPELQNQARNQFYLLELPLENPLGLVGTIKAWDWTPMGWHPSMPKGSGLPAICKFGCRDAPQNLARRVDLALGTSLVENWDFILHKVPEVEFLLPNDLEVLIEALNKKYDIKVEFDNGVPKELGREKIHDRA